MAILLHSQKLTLTDKILNLFNNLNDVRLQKLKLRGKFKCKRFAELNVTVKS